MNAGEVVNTLFCLLMVGLVVGTAISATAAGRASGRRADKALEEQPNPHTLAPSSAGERSENE